MSDEQNRKPELKYSTPSKLVLVGAAATVLALINILAGRGTQPLAVQILEQVVLAAGLFTLVAGLAMRMLGRK